MSHPEPRSEQFSFGGLRFDVSFRTRGATLRVEGHVGGEWMELLRFDDFVDTPHYHVPATGASIDFDRANGDPLEWYLTQIRDHLADWLITAGFADIVPSVDTAAVTANIGALRDAMHACVPAGFERVLGLGLRRVS